MSRTEPQNTLTEKEKGDIVQAVIHDFSSEPFIIVNAAMVYNIRYNSESVNEK